MPPCFLSTSRDCDFTTSLGSVFQCLTTLEEILSNVQPEPLLVQLEAMTYLSVTCILTPSQLQPLLLVEWELQTKFMREVFLLIHKAQKSTHLLSKLFLRDMSLGLAGSSPSLRLCQQFKFYNFVQQVLMMSNQIRLPPQKNNLL